MATQKKLDGYKGELTPQQIADGMNAAVRNAKRLADDASLLLRENRYPTAASLATLSIEESGKVSILRALSTARSSDEIKDEWRNYRSHTSKNQSWILPQLVENGAQKLEDFRSLFDAESDHPFLLDQVKQLGFYTDCLGNRHWSAPEDIVDEALARKLVMTANILARDSCYTGREIELWIEHVGPAWKKDMAWMKQALVNWYAAMQAEGLSPEGENKMRGFIHGK